jgi:DNA primase
MNCEQAKAIPISEILEKLKFKPTKEDETDAYYIAPWRDENSASLHINKKNNIWFDHGIGKGGNILDFVCRWLKSTGEDHTIHDALRWLRNMNFTDGVVKDKPNKVIKTSSWKLLNVRPIKDLALIRYIENRGIDFWLAEKHICEVYIQSKKTNKKLYAIGFKNEDGGYELRNPFLKSCVRPKTITFIRGSIAKPSGIHLFEGFMDYLTFLTINEGCHEDDVIVLNSINCLDDALAYIKGYGYTDGFTWMDNDTGGTLATVTLAKLFQFENIRHTKMNYEYADHKDLNAAHISKLTMNQ